MDRLVLVHGLIALTLAGLLLSWGVLLSPPMKPVREALGIGELEGSRFNGFGAEIIAGDREAAYEFLGRIAHYYHSLFAVLLYGTLVVLVAGYRPSNKGAILGLAGLGALMTLTGGIFYAYVSHRFYWHGLFIAGLAVLFSSGVLALASFRPRDHLERALWITGALMLLGGLIGGYVGASYMDEEASREFRDAVIASRFDPDLAEENWLWRAWTAHQHAMIALALVLVFLAAVRLVGLRDTRVTKPASMLLAPSTAIMALASYSVWIVGGGAHLLITPAALLLVTSTLVLSFLAKSYPLSDPRGALVWGLRLGNIAIWLFVNAPGAIIAMSLREPTIFFDPQVRHPSWDWMELAFNIGHWHLLLTGWGVTLLLSAAVIAMPRRLGALSAWLAIAGYMTAGAGATLYVLTASPGEYSPNPYDNIWLRLLVEPGLTALSLGVVLGYLGVARVTLKSLRTSRG